VEINGIEIFRFSPEGKVVESWDSYDQLGIMRQSFEQELRVAQRIQRALLPKEVSTIEGWEITAYYRPAREVGGVSTTSWSWRMVALALSLGTPRARGCLRLW
jgi:serine phosphatase RsbU (regulator of sigma subunit)